jgi:hypothetical protein
MQHTAWQAVPVHCINLALDVGMFMAKLKPSWYCSPFCCCSLFATCGLVIGVPKAVQDNVLSIVQGSGL